jgi:hypothetical protein
MATIRPDSAKLLGDLCPLGPFHPTASGRGIAAMSRKINNSRKIKIIKTAARRRPGRTASDIDRRLQVT